MNPSRALPVAYRAAKKRNETSKEVPVLPPWMSTFLHNNTRCGALADSPMPVH